MLAHVLLRLGRIWGDDELERLGVSVLRLVAPMLDRAPGAFGWALCALDLWLAPRARSRSSGRSTARSRGQRSRRSRRTTVVAVGPGDGVPLLEGKGLVDGKPAVYVCERFACRAPVTDAASTLWRLDLQRMTTIEQTGAEEVAWDLSDLYASGDDPRIESDFAEAEAAAAAFRDRTYGKVATLSAAELADAITEYERIEAAATRALYYAHMSFSTDMADTGRGRPRREARREGCRPRDPAALLRARMGGDRGRQGRELCSRTRRSTTGATGSRRSASSGRIC